MKSLSAHGIILRRIDYGEADRIITMLTDEYGKIRVMAKGVRKSKSKMAGGIELFSVSEIHFIKGRSDIGTLVSTRMLKHYGNIVKDLDRTELAYRMLKSIDKTLEDETGQEYFDILHEGIATLDNSKLPMAVADASFAMRLMALGGHVPDFTTDSDGNKLDPAARYEFDFEQVAFRTVDEGPYDQNHIKVLKLLAYNSPQKVAAVQGISKYAEQLRPIVHGLSSQYIPA